MTKKVALVTGGSRGIGAAICKKLGADGVIVIVNYLSNKESALQVVKEITDKGGIAVALQADARDADSMKNLINEAQKLFGEINLLVSNANIDFPVMPFAEMDWQGFSLKTHNELHAAFNATKSVIENMKKNNFGRIVFISSTLSKMPAPGYIAHGTAKSALNEFSHYLAHELGPFGITVNAVAPGFTLTEATKNVPAETKAFYENITPLRKVANPEDIANGVSFLLSEQASHITGVYLPISGGL